MSNALRDAVWQNGPTDPTMKFVLLSLCDRADKHGYCWPSHDDTAKRTGFSKKTVKTATKKLEDAGWIRTEARYATGRERSSNGIYINADMLLGGVTATPPNPVEVGKELPQVGTLLPQVGYVLPPGGVTATPESFIESFNEPEEVAAAPAPAIVDPIEELDRHFYGLTLLHPPADPKAYRRTWEEPLKTFLAHAGGDVEQAKTLIAQAVELARTPTWRPEPYPLSSPHSIVNIATRHLAERKGTTAAVDADSLWSQALDAIRHNRFSDGRLKAAINAVGFDNIRSANGYDTDRLKSRLAREYTRAPAGAV